MTGSAARTASFDQVSQLAGVLLRRVDELADQLLSDLPHDSHTANNSAGLPRQEVRRCCEDNLASLLRILGSGEPVGGHLFDTARQTGRLRAEQQVPLDTVLSTYRLGGRVLWEALVDLAKRDDGIDRDSLLDLASTVWAMIDSVSAEVAGAYRRAELELLRTDEQRRYALLDDLLANRGEDTVVARAAADALDLPVDATYVVVTAAASEDGRPSLRTPGDMLAIRGIRSLWQQRSETLTGLVVVPQPALTGLIMLLERIARGPVGLSPRVHGLVEVATGYRLALLALRTVRRGTTQVASLDDRLQEALLVESPELAARLVTCALGPLFALPQRESDMLIDTLRAWLDANCSASNTAERLYCHRNTVLNRLHRLEDLLVVPMYDPRGQVQLRLALAALELR
ncbi:helix-turn-helix domain-containing protein [Fodinicola feengrottensis]|uniref:Helix-turn-helix domain-containing protein n=1 Tax=Fodinicola feengrottensis TaxID=435914 RepID=A0ABP4VF57_9ACTN